MFVSAVWWDDQACYQGWDLSACEVPPPITSPGGFSASSFPNLWCPRPGPITHRHVRGLGMGRVGIAHSISEQGMTTAIPALGWQCHVHSMGNPAGVSLSQTLSASWCEGCNIWGHLSSVCWGKGPVGKTGAWLHFSAPQTPGSQQVMHPHAKLWAGLCGHSL